MRPTYENNVLTHRETNPPDNVGDLVRPTYENNVLTHRETHLPDNVGRLVKLIHRNIFRHAKNNLTTQELLPKGTAIVSVVSTVNLVLSMRRVLGRLSGSP